MKNRALSLISLSVFMSVILSTAVQAANFWENILRPFAGFPQAYMKYGAIIDAILFFIIFYGLISFALSKAMQEGKGSTLLYTGISLVGAVSLALFESQTGFSLMSFGPIFMLLFVAFMTFVIYKGLIGFGVHQKTAIAFSFASFFSVCTIFGFLDAIEKMGEWGQTIAGILSLLFFITLIFIFIHFGKFTTNLSRMITEGESPIQPGTGMGMGQAIRGILGGGAATPATPQATAAVTAALQGEEKKAEEAEKTLLDAAAYIKNAYDRVEKAAKKIEAEKGNTSPQAFQVMVEGEVDELTKAAAETQQARNMIGRYIMRQLKKESKSLSKYHNLKKSSDKENEALKKVREMRAILYTVWRKINIIQREMKKERKEFSMESKNRVVDTFFKEEAGNDGIKALFKILYGHIQTVKDLQDQVEAEIKKEEQNVAAQAKRMEHKVFVGPIKK